MPQKQASKKLAAELTTSAKRKSAAPTASQDGKRQPSKKRKAAEALPEAPPAETTSSSSSDAMPSTSSSSVDQAPSVSKRKATLASYPRLGPGLRTFVLNLRRRPDRLKHIEEVCRQLKLDYEVVEAVDGQALAASPNAAIKRRPPQRIASSAKDLEEWNKTKSDSSSSCTTTCGDSKTPDQPIRGFAGLDSATFELHWTEDDGKECEHVFKMAAHRLKATNLTKHGHELWGALGCSLSHQAILQRILDDESIEWGLILEDDATLAGPADEVRQVFDSAMAWIAANRKGWSLVYLGGHISTNIRAQAKAQWRCHKGLLECRCIYQTHAFIIHRRIINDVMRNLQNGMAADAALCSWSRRHAGEAFLFDPGLLQQPGGPNRFKDSDIFVDGEEFKRKHKEKSGGSYHFQPDVSLMNKSWQRKVVEAPDPESAENATRARVPAARSAAAVSKKQRVRVSPKKSARRKRPHATTRAIAGALDECIEQVAAARQGAARKEPEVIVVDDVDEEEEVMLIVDSDTPELTPLEAAQLCNELEADLESFASDTRLIIGMKKAALRTAYSMVGPQWRQCIAHAAFLLTCEEDDASDDHTRLSMARLVSMELEFSTEASQALLAAVVPALTRRPPNRTHFERLTCECVANQLSSLIGQTVTTGSAEILCRPEASELLEMDDGIKVRSEHLEALEGNPVTSGEGKKTSQSAEQLTQGAIEEQHEEQGKPEKQPERLRQGTRPPPSLSAFSPKQQHEEDEVAAAPAQVKLKKERAEPSPQRGEAEGVQRTTPQKKASRSKRRSESSTGAQVNETPRKRARAQVSDAGSPAVDIVDNRSDPGSKRSQQRCSGSSCGAARADKEEEMQRKKEEEKLRSLSVRELRVRAKYLGVSQPVLHGLVEKSDFVQAILDHIACKSRP